MKDTSTKPLMPMMYFFPREECQIFIKKFMKPHSGNTKFEFIVRGRSRQTGPAKPCKYKERGFSSAVA